MHEVYLYGRIPWCYPAVESDNGARICKQQRKALQWPMTQLVCVCIYLLYKLQTCAHLSLPSRASAVVHWDAGLVACIASRALLRRRLMDRSLTFSAYNVCRRYSNSDNAHSFREFPIIIQHSTDSHVQLRLWDWNCLGPFDVTRDDCDTLWWQSSIKYRCALYKLIFAQLKSFVMHFAIPLLLGDYVWYVKLNYLVRSPWNFFSWLLIVNTDFPARATNAVRQKLK